MVKQCVCVYVCVQLAVKACSRLMNGNYNEAGTWVNASLERDLSSVIEVRQARRLRSEPWMGLRLARSPALKEIIQFNQLCSVHDTEVTLHFSDSGEWSNACLATIG